MAAVASSDRILTTFPSQEAADMLHNLSLDPETEPEVPVAGNKGAYGGNGGGFLCQLPTDQASFTAEATKGANNLSVLPSGGSVAVNKGSNQKKLGYQNTSFHPKGSYAKGTYPMGFYSPAYQYPRFGYDGNFASGKNNSLHHYPYLNSHQARTGEVGQSFGYMDNMYSNVGMYGPYMNALGTGFGYGSYGYDTWKHVPNWYAFNNFYKTRSYGFHGYCKENVDGLNELNRGPRAKGFKTQDGSQLTTLDSKEQKAAETENPKENLSLPDSKDYNQEDFPETYLDAKFFVIKSYSEDDIHKSIKYNVWSSTPNGNKKLDEAYTEAKDKSDGCPIFLLFSVNTSGQFVGLAEMVGPVDFNKTVGYWQQDKWIGCFPVKWHIIKDVPNSSLRHIILENNENKPVTNSRDTQEVKLEQGIKVIKIFKDHSSKTCILDDFAFYESRQKIIQERKAKHQQFKKQTLGADDNKNNGDKTSMNKLPKAKETSLQKELETASEVRGETKPQKENGSAIATPNGVASAC